MIVKWLWVRVFHYHSHCTLFCLHRCLFYQIADYSIFGNPPPKSISGFRSISVFFFLYLACYRGKVRMRRWISHMIFLGGLVRIKICCGTINSTEIKATAVLPFVEDLSEKLRCCIRLRIHAIFKWETTLRLRLARPIDAVDLARQGGGVYIGETAKPERQRHCIRLAETQPPRLKSTPTTPDPALFETK